MLWLDATTTKCLVSPEPLIIMRLGTTVTTNINAGIRIVITIKDRVFTLSRYSRRAIIKVLRMVAPHSANVFVSRLCIVSPDYINKNLFQRRLHQFKLIDPGTGSHGLQKLL